MNIILHSSPLKSMSYFIQSFWDINFKLGGLAVGYDDAT